MSQELSKNVEVYGQRVGGALDVIDAAFPNIVLNRDVATTAALSDVLLDMRSALTVPQAIGAVATR